MILKEDQQKTSAAHTWMPF